MNNSYIVISAVALVLLLAIFQLFANAQTVTTDTISKPEELTCSSCCGGSCGSCCANGVCSKTNTGTSSCGC